MKWNGATNCAQSPTRFWARTRVLQQESGSLPTHAARKFNLPATCLKETCARAEKLVGLCARSLSGLGTFLHSARVQLLPPQWD